MGEEFEELNRTFYEITEFELLKNIASRPGMYVGDNRLDYIQCFLDGFYMSNRIILKEKFHCNNNYNMQKWLFYKESASIAHAASINSWSLMKRCYGNGKEACEQFKVFIEETPYTKDRYDIEDTVAKHIFQIYCHYHWNLGSENTHFHPEISKEYYPLSQHIKDIIGKIENSYESIVPIVSQMILEPYKDLWIYLHYEKYFLQVRFLYYTKSKGWIDNTTLVNQENYYRNLIILHAYVSLVQQEKHSNHIVTIHSKNNKVFVDTMEVVDYWNEIFNHGAEKSMCNESPMSSLYSAWRKTIN